MEVRMARRTDRPLLQVRVSFETTRLGPQHLIDAYARLVPLIRRARSGRKRSEGQSSKMKVAGVKAGAEP
jgi:hypothetical protein